MRSVNGTTSILLFLTIFGVIYISDARRNRVCPDRSGVIGICLFDPLRNCLSDSECRLKGRNLLCCSSGCGKECLLGVRRQYGNSGSRQPYMRYPYNPYRRIARSTITDEDREGVILGVDTLLNQLLDQIKSYNDEHADPKIIKDSSSPKEPNSVKESKSREKQINFPTGTHDREVYDNNNEINQQTQNLPFVNEDNHLHLYASNSDVANEENDENINKGNFISSIFKTLTAHDRIEEEKMEDLRRRLRKAERKESKRRFFDAISNALAKADLFAHTSDEAHNYDLQSSKTNIDGINDEVSRKSGNIYQNKVIFEDE